MPILDRESWLIIFYRRAEFGIYVLSSPAEKEMKEKHHIGDARTLNVYTLMYALLRCCDIMA